MERYEYMQILLKVFPQNIIDQYNLNEKETNGFIYLEIRRSVYGLPQSCRLANDYPNNKLAPEGYYKVTHTPGLQKKISHPVAFSLVIDNFGIKYVGKEHADHLIRSLKKEFTIIKDLDIILYCGITLEWNYV